MKAKKKLAAGSGGSIVVDRCQVCDSPNLVIGKVDQAADHKQRIRRSLKVPSNELASRLLRKLKQELLVALIGMLA